MSGVSISVVSSRPEPFAATPTLALRLAIQAPDAEPVHAMVLNVQIRIEPQRRRHTPEEAAQLVELFGAPKQWGDSLKPFLWTHVTTSVAEFTGRTEVDLPVPCSYDLEVAAAKYLHSLDDGEIPLLLLFSGTVFGFQDGRMVVRPVPWDVEAAHRLPVSVWRATMDAYFPNEGWIRLPTATIDALVRYKADRALTSWGDTIERLLKEAGP